jgi:hypothetical protein
MEIFKKAFSHYITLEKEDNNLVSQIIIEIKNMKEPFSDLLNYLNTYINHENSKFRKSALRVISLLLEKLPCLDVSNEINKLFEIAFNKLQELQIASSAARIIYCIIDRYKDKLDMSEVYNMILKNFNNENFNIPNYNQETRSYAIKTLSIFLDYSSQTFFLDRAYEYLQMVLDAIDSEKDPRNIILIFNLIHRINTSLDNQTLSPFNKRFFEVLDEYYPIEFTPPKNSPELITAELLTTKLNVCLSSNPGYIEFLIESIKGNIILTQIRSNQTLQNLN